MTDEMCLDEPLVPLLGGPADGLAFPFARPLSEHIWWIPSSPPVVVQATEHGEQAPAADELRRMVGGVRYRLVWRQGGPVYVVEQVSDEPGALLDVMKEASCQPQP